MAARKKKTTTKSTARKTKTTTTRKPSAKSLPRKTARTAKSTATKTSSTRPQEADPLMQASSNVVQALFGNRPQDAQEQAFTFGQQNMESLAKSADKASCSLREAMEIGKAQIDATVESNKRTTAASQKLYEQWMQTSNAAFSDQLTLAKDWFSCRTVEDFANISNKLIQAQWSQTLEQTSHWSDAWFKWASDASAPLTEAMTNAPKRIDKLIR